MLASACSGVAGIIAFSCDSSSACSADMAISVFCEGVSAVAKFDVEGAATLEATVGVFAEVFTPRDIVAIAKFVAKIPSRQTAITAKEILNFLCIFIPTE
jgi:hypothetical protein